MRVLARYSRAFVCLFFAAFLLLGLLTAPQYGQPWDEQDEMDILRMNLWEYARAFGLDESAFERRAEQGGALTINALVPVSESIERDHGIATFYPLAGVVMSDTMSEHTRSLLWHMYCWCLFALGAFALYKCCRTLGFSRGVSLLAALFLLLSPRFFAQGHYNNKDIVLFSLTLCVLWQALALIRKPTLLHALLFGLVGALAANARIAGLAVWGLCGVMVVVHHALQKTLNRQTLLSGATAIGSAAVLYALLTPALWHAPMAFISYLIDNATAFQRWQNFVLFRGAVFNLRQTSLPWYYLPYMMLATTPLWALLLIFVGQLTGLRACTKRETEPILRTGLWLTTLVWLLSLGFALITCTTVYNGWRHFYFLYGPMLILAAYGASCLWRALRDKKLMRCVFAGLLGLCMALTGIGIGTQRPYQYAYYNPLVLLKGDGYVEHDYWNVSAQNALAALADKTTGQLTIGWADVWAENAVTHGVYTLPDNVKQRFVCTDTSNAPYVLENPTYTHFSSFVPTNDMREVVCITAYGKPIMRVWERQEVVE